jgi:hypothetical protein
MLAACIIIVSHSMGGYISDFAARVADANARGCRVEIRGTCASACTLYLGAENVCVAPEARLAFHTARRSVMGGLAVKEVPEEIRRPYEALMAAHYPEPIRSWFWNDVRHRPFSEWARLSGEELISHGVPRCD